jgi:prepilin-type N-terminal cleavage/methylation domain-containing protein
MPMNPADMRGCLDGDDPNQCSGFTLIELMVVVSIVGILVTLAIQNFISYQCKAKQAEAKANLGAIYVGEQSYRAEYLAYSDNFGVIGWEPRGTTRYAYSVTTATSTNFTAQALSTVIDNDATVDRWTIDHSKVLQNPSNDCGN